MPRGVSRAAVLVCSELYGGPLERPSGSCIQAGQMRNALGLRDFDLDLLGGRNRSEGRARPNGLKGLGYGSDCGALGNGGC
jgi:hypothetical protein